MDVKYFYVLFISSIISFGLAQYTRSGSQRYIAARRGETPPCVLKPGQTYCENVQNYPVDRILSAIKRSSFNVKSLFVDETDDEGPNFGPRNIVRRATNLPLPYREVVRR